MPVYISLTTNVILVLELFIFMSYKSYDAYNAVSVVEMMRNQQNTNEIIWTWLKILLNKFLLISNLIIFASFIFVFWLPWNTYILQ